MSITKNILDDMIKEVLKVLPHKSDTKLYIEDDKLILQNNLINTTLAEGRNNILFAYLRSLLSNKTILIQQELDNILLFLKKLDIAASIVVSTSYTFEHLNQRFSSFIENKYTVYIPRYNTATFSNIEHLIQYLNNIGYDSYKNYSSF